jgi:3-deoxy-D-manno-octulosonate 8-phosphate phosphatase (KDO 8-P phosphatase)
VFLGVSDKMVVYKKYLADNGLKDQEVVYVGDDLPDYPVMKGVGVAVCPSDASEEIKTVSKYISPFAGGKGCVRDIIEQVLKVKGQWMDEDSFTW